MKYDYPRYVAYYSRLMPELEGRILRQIRVNIVVPEFNVLFLGLGEQAYAVSGEIGSEILGISKIVGMPELTERDSRIVRTFPLFDRFIDRRIKQVRMIGEAWNGHGFELSFEGLLGETMLIQSIYAGDKEKDFG